MKYDALLNIVGRDKDWIICHEQVKNIYDPSSPKFQSPKLNIYVKLLQEGRVFPPVVLDEKNWVVDGTHRLHAYKRLGRKYVPVIKPTGKGTGKVKDLIYKKGKFVEMTEAPVCLGCGSNMTFVPYGYTPEPMLEFPEGLPRGPIYYCRPCKIIVNQRKFLLWKSVS